jgi:hypothetical protein
MTDMQTVRITGLQNRMPAAVLLLVTFDLDPATRGLSTVPNKPLVALRAEMALPPASSEPDEAGWAAAGQAA